jgi:hypothetical protein
MHDSVPSMKTSAARRLLLLWLISAAGIAHAIDYTDLWYAKSEPGWGTNVVESGDFLFLTFFVYGADQRPVWYSAQLQRDTSGDFDGYLGPLYSTTGTWLALPWDPQRFTTTVAGTAAFQPTSAYAAVLSYTVNGLARVVKAIERQPLTRIPLQGTYTSVVSATSVNCATSPSSQEYIAELSIREPNGPGSIELGVVRADAPTCTLTADLSATGRLRSAANGRFTCADGEHGSAQFDEVAATQHGIEGRWSMASTSGCTRSSVFAAIAK